MSVWASIVWEKDNIDVWWYGKHFQAVIPTIESLNAEPTPDEELVPQVDNQYTLNFNNNLIWITNVEIVPYIDNKYQIDVINFKDATVPKVDTMYLLDIKDYEYTDEYIVQVDKIYSIDEYIADDKPIEPIEGDYIGVGKEYTVT